MEDKDSFVNSDFLKSVFGNEYKSALEFVSSIHGDIDTAPILK